MTSERQQFSLAQFARLPGRVYGVVSIDGDTSEWVQLVKSDLVAALRERGETGVVLIPDVLGGWLYDGVTYNS